MKDSAPAAVSAASPNAVKELNRSQGYRLFSWIVSHPKRVLIFGLLLMALVISQITSLTKDTRADAFLADDNSALVYREKVKKIFGLSDPLVIAVVAKDSIFTPEGLNAVQAVTDVVMDLNNIDPDGITSLATENNIFGTQEGMEVEPFYEYEIESQAEALAVRDAIRDFPLYQGSLVAQDESATLVVAELLDEKLVEQSYDDMVIAMNELTLPQDIQLYVAGEGAVSGYLGSYIDADAKRLNPLAGVIITLIVFIAFVRFGPIIMGNLVIAASVLMTIGLMAFVGVPFYVITNALPVILIGISVADSIHIYSEYFERRALYPNESIKESIIQTMMEMWRPITLTTLTTVAGFMGLYFAAYMPPFKFFGLFTAVGVSVAWFYSLVVLPAAMSLIKTEVRPGFAAKVRSQKHDMTARFMVFLGRITARFAKSILALSLVIFVLGLFAASHLVVDEERIKTFHPSEALYVADEVINSRFDGSNYLDIVVNTQDIEGIFDLEVLAKMEALQVYAEGLDYVEGSTSLIDYLKQMNRSLNDGDKAFYRLPQDQDLIAQFFLLYSASAEPTDFEEEVDYDYQRANIRLTLNNGSYVNTKDVVEDLQSYLDKQFNDDKVNATLTGRVTLNYHWIKDLGESHFFGMGIALLLVLIVSSLLLKSPVAGFYTLIPVAMSILLVYSSMVLFSISLGIGTSMFAAVAIGLGVDFAIHTIERMRALYQVEKDMKKTFARFYPSTGRALLFNLLAIALGFGVLISSKVVPLNNFGAIVAISVVTSFLFSLTLLPALIMLFRPKFILQEKAVKSGVRLSNATPLLLVGVVGAGLFYQDKAQASQDDTALPDANWIVEQINHVEEGRQSSSKLSMTLIDRRGKVRQRETVSFRQYVGLEKQTVLYYLSPRNVKNTAFLIHDFPEAERDDDQWLYLPALRKARRISASDRGDYFLGTDFSYEDIKKEGKFETADFKFKTLAKETLNGVETIKLEAMPIDKKTSRELGYGRQEIWVDPSNWIIQKAEYWDIKMNPLKTLTISDIRKVEGIWTRHNLKMVNHKTGHSSEFIFSDMNYSKKIKNSVFTRQALSRGAPK